MRLEIVDTPPKDQAAHYKSVRSRFWSVPKAEEPVAPKPQPAPVKTASPISWTYGGTTVTGNVISFNFQRVTMAQIINVVCDFYEVKHNDIVSHRRTGRVVYARQVAMYLCRELTSNSYPMIGRAFGDRDHTTVLHGAKKIARLTQTDARMCDEIDILIRKIKS